MPEAKEFAVGFSLADVEEGVWGYWEQYPVTSCLRGGCLSLRCQRCPVPPRQALSPFQSSSLGCSCLCTGRALSQYLHLPSFRGVSNTPHCPLLTVRKPETPALGCRVFNGEPLGVPAA